MNTPQLSVVIPMYNEAENVEPLIQEVFDALQQISHEIIVVDDGSGDDTFKNLTIQQQTTPTLKIIKHQRNFGQSASLVSGIRAAEGTWIATLDGDGQNPPHDILKLLSDMGDEPDPYTLYAGNREKRQDSWLKKLTSRLGNGIRRLLLRDQCPDTGCSLKLFAKSTFLTLPHFAHLHRYLPALFIRAGGNVVNIPVSHRPRIRGKSKYGIFNRLWVGISDLFGVMWLIRRPCCPSLEETLD